MTKKEQKIQIAKGNAIISAAEFSFGFGDITREEFDEKVNLGNCTILNDLDGIWGDLSGYMVTK